MKDYFIDLTPIGKPRMTRRDKFFAREAATKYWEYKKALQWLAKQSGYVQGDILAATFIIPMPERWSKQEKESMDGKPHKMKPDVDNIVKGIMDAFVVSDSHIYKLDVEKIWGRRGCIILKN